MSKQLKEILVEDEMRVIEKEFNAGVKARLDNKLALANPHDKTKKPHHHYSWLMGWIQQDEASESSLSRHVNEPEVKEQYQPPEA